MIRSLIFDMGGVLFSYDPLAFVRRYCQAPADAELVNRELFLSPEWRETDLGNLSDEAYLSLVLARIPERLRPVSRFLFEHWHEMPRPFPQMERLLCALRENGYPLYLLSNMSPRFYRFYRNIPAVQYFNGMLVSCDVHCMKPGPEIYRILFDRFGLMPEECFFTDDNPENAAAGKALGMTTFLFQGDFAALRDSLRAAGVKI